MMLTLHLRLCWIVTRAVCLWQLDSLSGLWNLFRGERPAETPTSMKLKGNVGKRWNVLRKRTDSYAYDVDQLFLGTLFFTVSIFLFPTVLVYASLFGLVGCLNCTPSFSLDDTEADSWARTGYVLGATASNSCAQWISAQIGVRSRLRLSCRHWKTAKSARERI